jgi:endo-1,4-beta-xylanase
MRILYGILLILAVTGCGKPASTGEETPALKNVFESAFLIGTAMNLSHIMGEDRQGLSLIKTHFNSITPENHTKWENIHPQPDTYNFDAADRFVEYGEQNGMFMVGHPLVWHSQTPQWVFQDASGQPVDRDTLLQHMREHIQTVVGRYKGRIQAWDVVNEAVADDGSMRASQWHSIIGEDYIQKAFQYAHEADPDAELYYNDYSLENPAKRATAVALIKSLQEKGARVTAVGTQGHWGFDWPSHDELTKTITDFAALGVKVMVTEMELEVLPTNYQGADIANKSEWDETIDPYRNGLPEDMQQKLAQRYRELFKVLLDHRDAITRVTFWGVTDGDSWKNNWPVQGRTNHPLLFDREGQAKAAFHSVVELAQQELEKK